MRFLFLLCFLAACSATTSEQQTNDVRDAATDSIVQIGDSRTNPSTTLDSLVDSVAESAVDSSRGAADLAADAPLSPASQAFVDQFAQPFCERIAACCAQARLDTTGIDACIAWQLSYYQTGLDNGTEVPVPSAINTFLADIADSCNEPPYALLDSLTTGTVQPGDPCGPTGSCAGESAFCLFSGDAATGTCVTAPRGALGDNCAMTCNDVSLCGGVSANPSPPYAACYDQDGLRCDSTSQKCVAVTAIGAACSDPLECGVHVQCLDGTCQAMIPQGGLCGTALECDNELECQGLPYTCEPMSIAWDSSCNP